MRQRALERQIAGIAALEEPARRALYFHVVDRGGGVSREAAAAAAGVSRALAAFHLDKLVEAGLLVVEFRRLTGKTGPGAGRPAKLYSRAPDQVAVSLPPRSYALVAGLFAEALDRDPGPARRELKRVARAFGRQLARATRDSARGRARAGGAGLGALVAALESLGYEPVTRPDGEVRLRNCPFHALTERHKDLVCGANLALLGGLVGERAGAKAGKFEAVLDPQPGMCCVALRPVRGISAARAARRGRSITD